MKKREASKRCARTPAGIAEQLNVECDRDVGLGEAKVKRALYMNERLGALILADLLPLTIDFCTRAFT